MIQCFSKDRLIETTDTVKPIKSYSQVNQTYRILKEFQPLETFSFILWNKWFQAMKLLVSRHETNGFNG
ncbi:hypothetical protein HMPREF2815_02535 [Bacteroides sp. HMSC068A09]|jgi:hypothetical protein|nr:hypothetical protein HMPREF2815_02535 [Bacteroides sp. HMSC068A09]OFL03706.1 hypothetical protein HMPREF2794_05570 [Bacteroides sp. HMSC067B03]RGU17378.1 hypothetical protein DWW93_05440 [Bacteroides faecis]RYT89896.1 hypothetical protein EAJ04_06805 [Bacteroides faecis]